MVKILILTLCALIVLCKLSESKPYVSEVHPQYLKNRNIASDSYSRGQGGNQRDESSSWGREDYDQYGGGGSNFRRQDNDHQGNGGNSRNHGSFSDSYTSGRSQNQRRENLRSTYDDGDDRPTWD